MTRSEESNQRFSSTAAAVVASMRPPFLTLPPVCVLLGWSCLVFNEYPVNYWHLLLVVLGGLAAHISINTLNEYHDFRSGLDFHTHRTPFSGGSGSLPVQPKAANFVLALGVATLIITAVIGVFFLTRTGLALLPFGFAGLVVIVLYTTILTHSPFWCLVAPGLGFGTFMVIGSYLALGGPWSLTPVFASMVPFFLVSNLLLINQFPDYQADREVGRRHLIIVHGVPAGVRIYGIFLILTYLSIIAGVVVGYLPVGSLLGVLTAPLGLQIYLGLKKRAEDIPALIPLLGKNVILIHATPLLVIVGMLIA